MKGFMIFINICFFMLIVTSCTTWHLVEVNPYLKAHNEIMIRPELRQLLSEKKGNIKIVLRVPTLVPQVSQSEIEKRNKLYDLVERHLYKAGFIVRDRALLEKVLESGPTSFQDMATKVDTDLILEIISIDTNVDLSHRFYYDPALKQTGQLIEKYDDGTPGPVFPLLGGKLDCRVITVKDGAITGVLSLFCVPFNPKFVVIAPHISPKIPEPNPQNYVGYKFGDPNETVEFLVSMLIQTLLDYKMVVIEVGAQASTYGLKTGDIVFAINGQEVFNFSQAMELVERSEEQIEFNIKRETQILTITIPKKQIFFDVKFQFKPV